MLVIQQIRDEEIEAPGETGAMEVHFRSVGQECLARFAITEDRSLTDVIHVAFTNPLRHFIKAQRTDQAAREFMCQFMGNIVVECSGAGYWCPDGPFSLAIWTLVYRVSSRVRRGYAPPPPPAAGSRGSPPEGA